MLLQLEIGSVCSPTWATWLYDNYNVSVFASMSAAFYNAYLVVIQLRTSRCHKLAQKLTLTCNNELTRQQQTGYVRVCISLTLIVNAYLKTVTSS